MNPRILVALSVASVLAFTAGCTPAAKSGAAARAAVVAYATTSTVPRAKAPMCAEIPASFDPASTDPSVCTKAATSAASATCVEPTSSELPAVGMCS